MKKTIGTALVRSMMALLAASLLQNAWSQTIALPPAKKHPLTRTESEPDDHRDGGALRSLAGRTSIEITGYGEENS